jgi:hypothetical protein
MRSIDHLLEVAGGDAGEVEGTGGGGRGIERGGREEDEEVAGARAAAVGRHGWGIPEACGRRKEWDGRGRRWPVRKCRVVKTETGHAGRGSCDYSIPGKRIENTL